MRVGFGSSLPPFPLSPLILILTWHRRFPPARVWPPLPISAARRESEEEHLNTLPDMEAQEHLLELYFTYVHPSLPVVHKKAFFDVFKNA